MPENMKREEIAIISTPAIGNLVPAVEFATHLINHHHHRISVAILVISMPQRPLIDDYVISRASTPHIRFIQIPPVDPPPPHQYNSTIEFISLHIQNHKPKIKQTLKNLTTLVGIFIDMFCTPMIDVANDLGIPCYLFFASPAAYLGFVLHLTNLPATESVSQTTELTTVPSYANSVPSNVLPSFCIKKNESEQQLNAFEMVKEVGLSVELRLDSRDKGSDLVLAEEVERGVRELMDGGDDGELRKKVKDMSEKSRKALMENGSSFGSLGDLINMLLSNV
ncbi:hypothetical protein L6452_09711 [Arctium lappa]|uniref:Uncharacterized protein n=1 Tax=Arctium lappa TaxID=4217 RepID=A0ACB9DLP1_ARCLA|nr:hypothetical protein L6452_09711 [Arctium lappa]